MKIHGWGHYSYIESKVIKALSHQGIIQQVMHADFIIARGLGRSYGDSSLAPCVLDTQYLNHLLAFDEQAGLLTCSAGVSLKDILHVFIPKGWFLPVTPGTQYVTIGGAIASDVHGKNHHQAGSFSQYVTALEILLGNGEVVTASRTTHPKLFYATCGGMGLTGIILSAQIQLKPIRASYIRQRILKLPHLSDLFDQLEAQNPVPYSVAWVDCLARSGRLGRSLLMLGEHLEEPGELSVSKQKSWSIVWNMPACLLNQTVNRCLNRLYYQKKGASQESKIIRYESFFYPLDHLRDWYRLYGQPGFLQYQFVLPKAAGYLGMQTILAKIQDARVPIFLAVLKQLGRSNDNYLSFPMLGYTMAFDVKATPQAISLLNELDARVLDFGGRIYLTKDARMSESMFKASYPQWLIFEEVRHNYGALGKFASMQSKRLGLG